MDNEGGKRPVQPQKAGEYEKSIVRILREASSLVRKLLESQCKLFHVYQEINMDNNPLIRI